MITRHVLYTQRHKAREHMAAMEAGFPGERYDLDNNRLACKYDRDALHIIGGLQFGALERMREIRAAGLQYLFFDRAYFGGGPRSDRLRITANAYQKNAIDHWRGGGGETRRAQKLGVELEPWRTGRHVLVVPPGAAIRSLFGLGDWEAHTVARLKACTDRPLRVSYKDDPVPLAERLRDCHCVVTWTSNVAVDAVAAGVPAFTSEWAAAAPVTFGLGLLETEIETPRCNGQREAWAESLAWGQFNLHEIRCGFARSVVMEAFND